MNRTWARAGLLILALALSAGVWAWWSSPERRIRRILTAVAAAVNHDGPDTGLEAVAAVAALQQHLALEVSIDPGTGAAPIAGRQEVIAFAARLRAGSPMLRVQFFDDEIAWRDEATATLRSTAQVTSRSGEGEEIVDVHDVEATVERREGNWVVTHARALREEPVTGR